MSFDYTCTRCHSKQSVLALRFRRKQSTPDLLKPPPDTNNLFTRNLQKQTPSTTRPFFPTLQPHCTKVVVLAAAAAAQRRAKAIRSTHTIRFVHARGVQQQRCASYCAAGSASFPSAANSTLFFLVSGVAATFVPGHCGEKVSRPLG